MISTCFHYQLKSQKTKVNLYLGYLKIEDFYIRKWFSILSGIFRSYIIFCFSESSTWTLYCVSPPSFFYQQISWDPVIRTKNLLFSFWFVVQSFKNHYLNFIEIVEIYLQWHCLQLLSILVLYRNRIIGTWKLRD